MTTMAKTHTTHLGFSRDDTLVSKVLRWFTKGKYSHAFVLVDAGPLGQTVLEANWKGIWARPLTDYDRSHYDLVPLDSRAHGLAAWMLKLSGARYDYLGIAGFAVTILAKVLRVKMRNPLASPSAYFCSESIVLGLQHLGYPGAEKLDASTTSPHDLWKWATSPDRG